MTSIEDAFIHFCVPPQRAEIGSAGARAEREIDASWRAEFAGCFVGFSPSLAMAGLPPLDQIAAEYDDLPRQRAIFVLFFFCIYIHFSRKLVARRDVKLTISRPCRWIIVDD